MALQTQLSSSAKADDPVRRGFSVLSLVALGYWVVRSSRTMTAECESSFSRHVAPEVCWNSFALSNQRAQGMPDARCTRGLMRSVHRKCAHEHTGQRRTSDIPCAMALRLITCSPENGSFASVAPREAIASGCIDASTATSGPHVFAVRVSTVRRTMPQRPSQPVPRW